MSNFLTVQGAVIDFRRGFEINSLFDRGNLKGPEGLQGAFKYQDPESGCEQKYTITARLIDGTECVAYELAPTVDFSATCRNIFHAMLMVLQFRIAKCLSPQHKSEVENQFKAFVDHQRNETRFGAFDKTLNLLKDLDKTAFAEPGNTEQDSERGALIFKMLDKISKELKDFAACRTPEHSVDVVTRMEQKRYKGGLFGLQQGGETQPFVYPVEEEGKTLDDPRTMKLSNGKVICFDSRAYASQLDVYYQCGGDNAEVIDAVAMDRAWAQGCEARELGEKLYAGKWTDHQIKLYAAMLDEMGFFIEQFQQAVLECPENAQEGSPDGELMQEYAAKLDATFLKADQNKLNSTFIRAAGMERKMVLAEYRDDQMFRAFFASKVENDVRLTAGMLQNEIADVINTFATTSLHY